MKKLKFLASIFIGILLMILMHNISYATTKSEAVEDVNNFKKENPGASAIGTEFTIYQNTLESTNQLYCLEHYKSLISGLTFEVTGYLELNGTILTNQNGVSREDTTTLVLQRLLSSEDYGMDYGSYKDYGLTQQMLYLYIHDWLEWDPDNDGPMQNNREFCGLDSVYSSTDYNSGADNWDRYTAGGQDELTKLVAEVEEDIRNGDLDKYNSNVKLYILQHEGPEDIQTLMIAIPEPGEPDEPDEPDEPEKPNEPTNPGKGNVKISGTVWEDLFTGKQHNNNAKKDGGEPGVPNVKVNWKDAGGGIIASTITDASGYYEMYATIGIENHTYRIDKAQWERINNSYIEFEYNGLKYTTVAYGDKNEENVSKAIELENYRKALDAKFQEVTKDEVKTSGIQLSYRSTEPHKSELEQIVNDYADYSDFVVKAKTQDVVDHLVGKKVEEGGVEVYEFTSITETDYYCVHHCYYDGPDFKEDPYLGYVSGDYGGTWEDYTYQKYGIVQGVDHNATGQPEAHAFNDDCWYADKVWYDSDGDGKNDDYYYTNPYCHTTKHKTCGDVTEDAGHCLLAPYGYKLEERPEKWEIENVDLGLVKRDQPDIALTSDIYKVRVIMKGQEYTYLYNSRGISSPSATDLFDYTVKFSGKYTETYKRPVNPADIAYVNYHQTEDLLVYVTYNIVVENQSSTTPVVVQEIVNYYDAKYTINQANSSPGWTDTSKYGQSYSGGGFKAAYSTALAGQKIQPGEKSSIVSIEFRVNDDVVKGLITEDAPFKNVSEINIYTTYYGANTRYSEDRTAAQAGVTGSLYAGIDADSQPGNAQIQLDSSGSIATDTFEDDTDMAPTFLLKQDPNYKIVSGTVWEDTDANTTDNERLGDGMKPESEYGVAGAQVQLLTADGEQAYIYYIEGGTAKRFEAITTTDGSGNYHFGEGQLNGVVVDNYILKYTYGNANGIVTTINGGEPINARNYKSTIIKEPTVKSVIQGSGNSMWHLFTADNYSVAVDDLNERLTIPSLKYSNYDDPINMSAYSKSFKVQVEYTQQQIAEVNNDGEKKDRPFEHDWTVFDFGIIERAREDIVIDKTIENMKITLANGQVLTEGTPYEEKLNYVKALGTTDITTRAKAIKANQKLLYIEMDSEYIQGARLDILYKITVTNNSEIDYEYDPNLGGNEKYYYYGEKSSPIIHPTVEWIVDYMDPELSCTVGIESDKECNKEWEQITPLLNTEGTVVPASRLKNDGLISDATETRLKDGNYLIFMTDYFYDVTAGTSKSLNLFASKLLANQAEDYTYENHVEILQLNGKIARTIDRVEAGEQVTKQYKPGNYIPSLERTNAGTFQAYFAGLVNGGITGWGTVDGTIEYAGFHTQDDDMITIRITPPTGLENNMIIYITIGVVGLIVLAGGIYFIKKKVIR